MTSQEKEEIMVRISEEIKKTGREIIDLKELTKPISPENAIGRVSRMDAINNKSVNENRLRVAENKIKKLHHSLRKSKEPNFGICARCGNDIQIGRLILLPESNFCIRCAS
ncbi:MAG: DnaK suppressor protein [Cryomorphaceae bacterium]|jgi:DnaK suppressor protein